MLGYAVKRALSAIGTVFAVAAITFFVMHAIPGGPFASEKAPDPAVRAALESRFLLDRPAGEQFVEYLSGFIRGDFGISLKTGREISAIVGESFGASAKIGGIAAALALGLGVLLGCAAAMGRGRWPDRLVLAATTLFASVPSFIAATVLMLVFCLELGWFGVWSASGSGAALPAVALALYPMSAIARLTRAGVLDALGQDYVRAARARGVREPQVVLLHGLRNALVPVVAYAGPMSAYLLTGSMVVEMVFTVGGLGTQFVTAIGNRDYPVIMAIAILLAALMSLASLISDVACHFIDPKISLE